MDVILAAQIDHRQFRGDVAAKFYVSVLVEVKLRHGAGTSRRPPGVRAINLRLQSREKEALSHVAVGGNQTYMKAVTLDRHVEQRNVQSVQVGVFSHVGDREPLRPLRLADGCERSFFGFKVMKREVAVAVPQERRHEGFFFSALGL